MRRIFALCLAGSVAVTLSFMHTSTAVAASQQHAKHLMKTRHHLRPQSAAISASNLLYGGGPVETTPSVYIIYWGPEWAGGFSSCDSGGNCATSGQAQNYVNSFFGSVGGSSWNNTNTQYCQGTASGSDTCTGGVQFITNPGAELRGVWNDTSAVPSTPSDADIANAALRGVGQFGYDPNATYFVFTPTGKSTSGFGSQYCAYHSATSSSAGAVAYANMPYVPDAGSSCGQNFVNGTDDSFGHGIFDGFSIVGGHEYAEAETDPQPSSGWVDVSGSENGDKCAWDPSSTNIGLGSNQYAVQPLWSNASSSCVLSY